MTQKPLNHWKDAPDRISLVKCGCLKCKGLHLSYSPWAPFVVNGEE